MADIDNKLKNINNFLKNEKITSGRIKDSFFYIYRFKRGMFVASEVNFHCNISDIVYCDKDMKTFIDIEIKISKYDFLNDFKKHKYEEAKVGLGSPFHQFYFCVPTNLKDFVLDYLNNNDINAGLIECTDFSYDIINDPFIRNLVAIKKAKILKTEDDSYKDKFRYNFLLRMTPELSNEKMKKYNTELYNKVLFNNY